MTEKQTSVYDRLKPLLQKTLYKNCDKHYEVNKHKTKFEGCPECEIDELEQEISNLKAALTREKKKSAVTESQINEINRTLEIIEKLIKKKS